MGHICMERKWPDMAHGQHEHVELSWTFVASVFRHPRLVMLLLTIAICSVGVVDHSIRCLLIVLAHFSFTADESNESIGQGSSFSSIFSAT